LRTLVLEASLKLLPLLLESVSKHTSLFRVAPSKKPFTEEKIVVVCCATSALGPMETEDLLESSSLMSEDDVERCDTSYGAAGADTPRGKWMSIIDEKWNKAKAVVVPAVVLVTCVLSASSVGLAAHWKPQVSGVVLAAWKTQTWTLAVVPMVMHETLRQTRSSEYSNTVLWTTALRNDSRLRWHVAVASCAQMWWSASMLVALRFTSVSNAFLFNNAHGIMLVLYRILAGSGVHKQELLGVLLGLIGAVVAMWTPSTSSPSSRFGDLTALTGSLAGAVCVSLTREARDKLPSGVFSFLLNVLGAPLFLLIALSSPGAYSLSLSPETGLFGWLAPEMILFAVFLGAVCGLMGGTGLIVLFDFLPSLAISLVMLLEPIVGACLTAAFKLTPWPELHALCGASLVIIGIAFIVTSASSSESTTEKNLMSS